ncbi:hypothetical protein IQ219_02465 [Synechocystis sp. LEGE 06083]|uniref:hypothetical protein n=1 Tax=Synechocystis sp. LEGE 06083 TaxID=915336 RepID=UPI0018827468|nr:hypothetical protein [Synechocystis sp. LEGE 06083]MBE9194212.1 hypothetical protein [Synechocystis sp. LEGE 06083]
MTNTCIQFPSSPTASAIAKDGAIYQEICEVYTRLYQMEGALRCALPDLESGSAPAIETVYLVADLVGEMGKKLDLLSCRL